MKNSKFDDESVIDLRSSDQDEGDAEFKIKRFEETDRMIEGVATTPLSNKEQLQVNAPDKVKVKFDKFATLVATHTYQDIFEKHMDQDVIISTDLLTDLANAHEEKSDKRIPLMFLFGALIGVAIAWILFKT